jgi:hypothetical protein
MGRGDLTIRAVPLNSIRTDARNPTSRPRSDGAPSSTPRRLLDEAARLANFGELRIGARPDFE